MKVDTTKKNAERLFRGILAGNGDIYGRMVNGIGVKPAYPNGLEDIIPKLYGALEAGQVEDGRKLADKFLESATFLGDVDS
jgi:hypothetical protein